MKLYLPEKCEVLLAFAVSMSLSLAWLASYFIFLYFGGEFQWTHVNFISLSNGLTDRIET